MSSVKGGGALGPAFNIQNNYAENAKADRAVVAARDQAYVGTNQEALSQADEIGKLADRYLDTSAGDLLATTQNYLARVANPIDDLGFESADIKDLLGRIDDAQRSGALPPEVSEALDDAAETLGDYKHSRQTDFDPSSKPNDNFFYGPAFPPSFTPTPYPGFSPGYNAAQNMEADSVLGQANYASQMNPWTQTNQDMLDQANAFSSTADKYQNSPWGALAAETQEMLGRAAVKGDGQGYNPMAMQNLLGQIGAATSDPSMPQELKDAFEDAHSTLSPQAGGYEYGSQPGMTPFTPTPRFPGYSPGYNAAENREADGVLRRAQRASRWNPWTQTDRGMLREARQLSRQADKYQNTPWGALAAETQEMLGRVAVKGDGQGYNSAALQNLLGQLDVAMADPSMPPDLRSALGDASAELRPHAWSGEYGSQPDSFPHAPVFNPPAYPTPYSPYAAGQNAVADAVKAHADTQSHWFNTRRDAMSASDALQESADRHLDGPYGPLAAEAQNLLSRISVTNDGQGWSGAEAAAMYQQLTGALSDPMLAPDLRSSFGQAADVLGQAQFEVGEGSYPPYGPFFPHSRPGWDL